MSSLPPFAPFFLAAALALVLPGRARALVLVALPILGALNLYHLPDGTLWQLSFLSNELEPVRVDRLSRLFGYLFHIGCFSEALGCSIAGTPEAADSWFMGFQWRIAACSECQRHLGWYFDRVTPGSETDFFYGLILDRIQHE